MYITTSKNPSAETKDFSKKLCFFLGIYGKYENRGRKSIEDVIERAKKLGHSEILIVSEKDRKPSTISKIKIYGKDWYWADEIKFNKYVYKEKKGEKEKIGKEMFEVFVCKELKNLFELDEPMSDTYSKITFEVKNKKIKKVKKIKFSYKGYSLILEVL
jgi:rRNA maturation protein Rpf1